MKIHNPFDSDSLIVSSGFLVIVSIILIIVPGFIAQLLYLFPHIVFGLFFAGASYVLYRVIRYIFKGR